jgi:hypothetical protein
MSNRMAVLSDRLRHFAVIFSFLPLFIFAAALMFRPDYEHILVGLAVSCLFFGGVCWLAHGFAWAMVPKEPAEVKQPVVDRKPAEVMKPAEAVKPVEVIKPVEATKPAETTRASEVMKPAEAMKKPAEEIRPAEIKPAEEKTIIPEEDPPNAQYTITGRRIS